MHPTDTNLQKSIHTTMNRYLTPLILLVLFSCKKSEKEPELNVKINNLMAEITSMTEQKECATKAEDCRFKALSCGGAFVYNVTKVDTSKLFSKFLELQNLSAQLESSSFDCDIVTPDSTFIYDCKCVWGYKKR